VAVLGRKGRRQLAKPGSTGEGINPDQGSADACVRHSALVTVTERYEKKLWGDDEATK
jgi:hypothetical protein